MRISYGFDLYGRTIVTQNTKHPFMHSYAEGMFGLQVIYGAGIG